MYEQVLDPVGGSLFASAVRRLQVQAANEAGLNPTLLAAANSSGGCSAR